MVNLHRISAQSYVRLGLHLRPPVAGLPELIHVLCDMPGSKHCSDYVKGMLTLLHQQGHSNCEIARRLRISEGTVRYNIRKCVETGSMARAAGSGRPRKTDVRGDRFIKMVALQNRAATLRDIARSYEDATGVDIGSDTVRRRLATHGIFRRIAKRKPLLTRRHKADRLRWARDHAHWTEDDWNSVLWTDESKFTIFGNGKRRVMISRRKGEAYRDDCLQPTVKFGGKSVMVWGCFAAKGVGALHQIDGVMDQKIYLKIVKNIGMQSAKSLLGDRYVWQQDNDPKHTARSVKRFFADSGVTVMQWPSQSPDLNPIEHLWDDIDRRLRQGVRATSAADLFCKMQALWTATAEETTRKLVASMPGRIREVMKNRGGATSY